MKKLCSVPSGQIKLPGNNPHAIMAAFLLKLHGTRRLPAAQMALAAVTCWSLSGSKRSMMARRRNTTAWSVARTICCG